MTQGARSLLNFLRFRGGRNGQCWWKQSRMAEELGCHRSSIVRWVAELVAAGHAESIRRGSTSNLYTLRKTCGRQTSLPFSNATSVVAICDIERPRISLTETTLEKKQQQPSLVFPPYTITNEYGREDLNPEYLRLTEILRRAQGRIRRARSPIAYERAIIGIELRLAKERSCNTSSYFSTSNEGAKQEVAPRRRSGDPAKKPPEPEWNIRGPSDSGLEGSIAELARRKRLA